MKKLLPAYPGFTRRALTFTIDDANLKYDKIFIDIVRPYGIRGTFNLCADRMDREDGFYREFYNGFGIANHTNNHPYAIADNDRSEFVNEPAGNQPVDTDLFYLSPRGEGYYMKHTQRGWREWADDERYMDCVTSCQSRLERIFGRETVNGFVWPYCEQNNAKIKAFIKSLGFGSVRKTGDLLDTTDFALPDDRMAWSYNAHNTNLMEVMEKYDSAPDNGSLRFFAFGVHSWDFERDGDWEKLAAFAKKYGNRPTDYWYATVDEIFAYADAVKELKLTDKTLENPTELTLYVELDGVKTVIPPKTLLPI
ncbi:MAG: polysaccharide deacetylase family protein [Clostridia bacterium]|nr:polysaccharide deacetylase family protein [Clostridia bacterium]MBR3680931.1 polysaccharide deacetylase family protein [Clostridia bacterium]